MLQASMLVIGDEILGGFVEDTNSPWLAARLRDHHVPLTRIHTVPDEFDAVDDALQTELAAPRPRVIVTSGGIGSTPDDITYEAVAASLGRPVVEHPELVARIEGALEWTRSTGLEVTETFAWHMLRMARIPDGAQLIDGTRAFAPGVRVDLDGGAESAGASVVILPGVPSQFRAIVEGALEPRLFAGRNASLETVEITHLFPESALNPAFAEVQRQFPDVKLGSYPGAPMIVRLRGRPEDAEAAGAYVRGYLDELRASEAGTRLEQAWAERIGAAEARGR